MGEGGLQMIESVNILAPMLQSEGEHSKKQWGSRMWTIFFDRRATCAQCCRATARA